MRPDWRVSVKLPLRRHTQPFTYSYRAFFPKLVTCQQAIAPPRCCGVCVCVCVCVCVRACVRGIFLCVLLNVFGICV